MLALVSVDSDEEEASPSSSSPWVVSERSDDPLSNLSGGSGFSDTSFGFCRGKFTYGLILWLYLIIYTYSVL